MCPNWDHFECSGLTAVEFEKNVLHFCSPPCLSLVFPFATVKNDILINSGILHENAKVVKSVSKKPKKQLKSVKNKPKTGLSNSVKLNHFLEINCEYVDPSQLNGDFFENDLTIFQNKSNQ